MNIHAKDLTKEAPRSAYQTLGGYAILARAIDKGRAHINGTNGEYNFDCPVDNMLFSFAGIKGEDFKKVLESGADDDAAVAWFVEHSKVQDAEEIKKWSEHHHSDFSYANHPDEGKRAWFHGFCTSLGLDPMKTTLFDALDVDDKVTFSK